MERSYQALLVISFGGPEGPDEVLPFLENVLRGRVVPRERLEEVAGHYLHFGGVSPINGQVRALIEALRAELARARVALPVHWGNRNWRPLLVDALRAMAAEGVERALGLVTSAYGSYSGCRQYQEDLARARAEAGPRAPEVDLLPLFHAEPGFLEAGAERVREALLGLPEPERAGVPLVFTAHSVPVAMAAASPYVGQLRAACAAVAGRLGRSDWTLAYQSRSGPPGQPWLEPDLGAHLRALAAAGGRRVLVAPIGFVSDHMEVAYDLDLEARALCGELGLELLRAATVGTHPAFVSALREQVERALTGPGALRACAPDCCPPPARPAR